MSNSSLLSIRSRAFSIVSTGPWVSYDIGTILQSLIISFSFESIPNHSICSCFGQKMKVPSRLNEFIDHSIMVLFLISINGFGFSKPASASLSPFPAIGIMILNSFTHSRYERFTIFCKVCANSVKS